MNGIKYSKTSLSKSTSELNVEYDGENFVILNDKENIDKLCNVLAHLGARVHAAETEIEILKNQPSLTAAHQTKLIAARNAINDVLGEDIVVDYDSTNSNGIVINADVVDNNILPKMKRRVNFERNGGIFTYINLLNNGYTNSEISQKYGFSNAEELGKHISGVYGSVVNANYKRRVSPIVRYYQNTNNPKVPMLHFLMGYSYYDDNNFMTFDDIQNAYVNFCNMNNFEIVPQTNMVIGRILNTMYGSKIITNRSNKKFFNIGFKTNILTNKKVHNSESKLLETFTTIDDSIIDDDLSFICSEELHAYLVCKNILSEKFIYQKSPSYLRDFVPGHYCSLKDCRFALGKLPNDVANYEIRKKLTYNFSKIKCEIDSAGGIKALYGYAKKRLNASYTASIIMDNSLSNADGLYVTKYVKHYGFSGWPNFCNFVNSFDSWSCFKQALIEKRNSSIKMESN